MNEEVTPAGPVSQPHVPPEHPAVSQANRRSDYWVLAAGVVTSLLATGLVFFTSIASVLSGYDEDVYYEDTAADAGFFGDLLSFVVIGGIALILILTLVRMMRQQVLGNALQVEYSDYAWLREWSNQVAQDLHMPRVEIMVTQDPVINAYAFGFATPYTIVLNSGSIRWLTQEQLKAVVVHEMAHVKYHHTQIGTYLNLLRLMPILGTLNGWLLDFWSRRAELTADRLALCYLRDNEQVKESLIGVHVGPDVAKSFNDIARQWQVYMTSSYFNRFTQTFSSHPFLVRRLQHLDAKTAELSPMWSQAEVVKKPVRTRSTTKKSSDE
ncbi:M48 family metallopeptidase [Candidatus Saccharibacteria bacterium]|nr:M48 family metallopeptidase [Candidatus Saccharibacteria bacterium]